MTDFYRWALMLYTAWGITVRIHLLFFLITIPTCLRLIMTADGRIPWFDIVMISTVLVFLSVLLHEYGHAFAARWVGGSADEILIWPLGGLAFCSVPHYPRSNAIVTICGPLVNLVIVVLGSLTLLVGGFSPVSALNPFELSGAYTTPTYNYRDEKMYYSPSATGYMNAPLLERAKELGVKVKDDNGKSLPIPKEIASRLAPELPTWAMWAYRLVWINWWLFLFNMLLPAYPMDCGRLLHAYLWSRTDYRSATITCCYVGFGVAVFLLALALLTNENSLIGFSAFIGLTCYQTLRQELDTERGAFGYDFSQGYTSLERDDPPPKVKQPGPIQRWLNARKARKLQQEQESRAKDEQRLDDLLAKIASQGKNSLTDEERRFMERVSARYRDKQT